MTEIAGAPYGEGLIGRIDELESKSRATAIEVHRLRSCLRYIADVAYVDHHSGNANFEYLQHLAQSALNDAYTDASEVERVGLQAGVHDWMMACFGAEIAADKLERADRFIEEALELAQTMSGFSADRAHALVDYVFNRPQGEINQEVGGVMITLAALCNTVGVDIASEADRELARIWTKVEQIRAKQAAKPTGSALPIAQAAIAAMHPASGVFSIGDRVTKIKGSAWTGLVVGTYSTTLTPEGYAVESENEPGSVQIYPATALRQAGEV